MNKTKEVIPAYGRDYKTAGLARYAWETGKDFQLASIFDGQQLINKQDAETVGLHILIRFDRLTKLHDTHRPLPVKTKKMLFGPVPTKKPRKLGPCEFCGLPGFHHNKSLGIDLCVECTDQ